MAVIPTIPENISEEMCACGHTLSEHIDEGEYEPGRPPQGACLDPDCECEGFVLMGA